MDIQIFDFEIFMMTNTLRKMNKLLDNRLSAQAYYIRMERPMCLILEDLAPLGFRMANRQLGLDMDHCKLAIQGLARFHAASVALCEKVMIMSNDKFQFLNRNYIRMFMHVSILFVNTIKRI